MFHVMHLELASSQEDNETFIVLVRKGQTMVRLRQQPWLYIQPLDIKKNIWRACFQKPLTFTPTLIICSSGHSKVTNFQHKSSLQMENVDISTYWNLE